MSKLKDMSRIAARQERATQITLAVLQGWGQGRRDFPEPKQMAEYAYAVADALHEQAGWGTSDD